MIFKLLKNKQQKENLEGSQIFFFINFFIYLFLAVLDLRCCTGFSLVAVSGGYSSCHVPASHWRGFSCCRAWALSMWASIVAVHGLSSCGSLRMDWLDLLAVQGTLKSLLQHHSSKASILRRSAFFTVQLSHPYMTTGKTIALTRRTFVGGYIVDAKCLFAVFVVQWLDLV